jgi:hypothetical protein
MDGGKNKAMSTVREALNALNTQIHDKNFHATMVNMDLVPEGTSEENNTPHDLMQQTYDWRYAGKIKGHELPDDDTVFHVDLTTANLRFLGRAIEVYDRIHFEVHIEPALKQIVKKMGDINDNTER